MTRVPVEHRKSRGITKANDTLRRSAVNERARACVASLGSDLEDHDAEFAIDVLRAVVRAVGSALVLRAGVARAVGVLVGTLTNISPAWHAETAEALAAAEDLFRKDAA